MAPDFIFVEADGKCQFPAAGSLHGHRFDHGFGGILWSFCPVMLGILVPRSSEDILRMLVPGSREDILGMLVPGSSEDILGMLVPGSREDVLIVHSRRCYWTRLRK